MTHDVEEQVKLGFCLFLGQNLIGIPLLHHIQNTSYSLAVTRKMIAAMQAGISLFAGVFSCGQSYTVLRIINIIAI